jgi:hypothetical protein
MHSWIKAKCDLDLGSHSFPQVKELLIKEQKAHLTSDQRWKRTTNEVRQLGKNAHLPSCNGFQGINAQCSTSAGVQHPDSIQAYLQIIPPQKKKGERNGPGRMGKRWMRNS